MRETRIVRWYNNERKEEWEKEREREKEKEGER